MNRVEIEKVANEIKDVAVGEQVETAKGYYESAIKLNPEIISFKKS